MDRQYLGGEMTDEEKNEVLAKWAGWEFVRSECHDIMHFIDYWRHPSELNCERTLPDFLYSLDAQAKWLWPKLLAMKVQTMSNGDKYMATVSYRDSRNQIGEPWRIQELCDTPAEACAEAILSLIGGDDG